MNLPKPPNSCRRCGATSYRPVIERGPDGRLRPAGQFRCNGCSVVFTAIDEWRVLSRPSAS